MSAALSSRSDPKPQLGLTSLLAPARSSLAPVALDESICTMGVMIASPTTFADPRSMVAAPAYRVNFWAPLSGGAWSLDAFVLFEVADVTEVMAWVEQHRDARKVEVFVEVEGGPETPKAEPRRSGLIRILGDDPNKGVSVPMGTFVHEEIAAGIPR